MKFVYAIIYLSFLSLLGCGGDGNLVDCSDTIGPVPLNMSKTVAATVFVTSSGDKSYSVQGSGMESVSGIQISITYDSASLSTPTVTQGSLVSGAMLAANTSLPGSIKIAIISTKPFSSSGQIATISFANQQGSGGITSANVSMINEKGAGVPASVSIANGSGSTVANSNSPTSTSCR